MTITVQPVPRSSVAESVGISDQVAISVRTSQRSSVAESVGISDEVAINVLSAVAADVAEAIGIADDVTITVVPGGPSVTADLEAVFGVVQPQPVGIGQPARVQVAVRNNGPDAVTDAMAAFRAFGDVVAGVLPPGCSETAEPADGGAEIVCAVGPIDVLGTAFPPTVTFVPQSAGTFAVLIVAWSSGLDPNPANDEFATVIIAVP